MTRHDGAQAGQTLWPSLVAPSTHGDDDQCFVSARGVRLTTASGRDLLCGTSGLWNANLGYGNSAIADAVHEAMLDASYLSVFRYENAHARAAADALVELAGAPHFDKVMFSTSGGAANDLVMKVTRQFHQLRSEPGRRLVVGLQNGYHGLTFGSFGLTHDDLGQHVYGVDRSLVRHVEANKIDQLERLLQRHGDKVAALVLEPVQGSGAVPLDHEYIEAAGRLADEHDVLIVADEVATGFHRIGEPFASTTWSRQPDILVTSKGLTNGTSAAAAVLLNGRVAEPFFAVDALVSHAETQAGTAVSCAAILATLSEMRRLDAKSLSTNLSAQLDTELEQLVADVPSVMTTTGAGCFRSIRLAGADGAPLAAPEVPRVVAAIREAGAVVHPGPGGVQVIPALTYTDADVRELFDAVRKGLEIVAGGAVS